VVEVEVDPADDEPPEDDPLPDDETDPADSVPDDGPLPDWPVVPSDDGAEEDGVGEAALDEVSGEDSPEPSGCGVPVAPVGAFGTLIETFGGAPLGWGTMVIGPTFAPPTWIGPTVIGACAAAAAEETGGELDVVAAPLVVVGVAELGGVVGAEVTSVPGVAAAGVLGAAAAGFMALAGRSAAAGAAGAGPGRIGTTAPLSEPAGAVPAACSVDWCRCGAR
jgi:hypothetical protein